MQKGMGEGGGVQEFVKSDAVSVPVVKGWLIEIFIPPLLQEALLENLKKN